jgi:hypothetical protein
MPNLPKSESIRFREAFTTNHLLLKVAGFEPDPSGWLYPILDIPAIVLLGDLILFHLHGYSFLNLFVIGRPDGTSTRPE